jgi:hypothetical protein
MLTYCWCDHRQFIDGTVDAHPSKSHQTPITNTDLVGRQSDDDGKNKFIQINDCKESLSYILNRMNLKQLEEIKTEAFYWVEFHISTEPIC